MSRLSRVSPAIPPGLDHTYALDIPPAWDRHQERTPPSLWCQPKRVRSSNFLLITFHWYKSLLIKRITSHNHSHETRALTILLNDWWECHIVFPLGSRIPMSFSRSLPRHDHWYVPLRGVCTYLCYYTYSLIPLFSHSNCSFPTLVSIFKKKN